MTKKKWERPKLIVLVRGKPEEAVLLACKHSDYNGPDERWGQCDFWRGRDLHGGSDECYPCESQPPS